MLIKIEKNISTPLYKQIIMQIKSLVDHGIIEVDTPLPSTRILAEVLGINRSTVSKAYEELQVLGYLKSRPGSYNIVQSRQKEAEYHPERKSNILWKEASNDQSEEIFNTFFHSLADTPSLSNPKDNHETNFSDLHLDPNLFPIEDLRRSFNKVLLDDGLAALDFCPPEGNRNLREYIALRLRLHGISTSYNEILITYGSQQALDLIIRLLGHPEKKAVIEAPTYFNIIPLLKFHKVGIVTVPMKKDGLDLDHLEKILNKEEVNFVYTTPNFHNPTGITTSYRHRERLLNICLEHNVPIIEDGFEEEMKYSGPVPLPIKSIDEKNIVIYLSSFSKILCPGLRVGWITADKECIARLTAIKRFSDLRCENLVQSVLCHFCKEGYYDLHLKRLHRIFRKRMETALKTMKECFPEKVTWTHPQGGYAIWVEIPKKLSPKQLHSFLREHGITISPGGYYYPHQGESEYFRLSISRISDNDLKEGLCRLGRILHSVC